MHNNTPFVVKCERISRRQAYYLQFPYNIELINRIKELPDETKKWNSSNKSWEVNTPSLLKLIKQFKGSNKIHFDFGDEKNRNIFIQQIKKAEIAEIEKKKLIFELNINKEKWVKYKEELENNYEQHIEKVHANLKEGVKLYPHQVVATMFINETKNTLISHEMGLGKTLQSIAYAEMNDFKKVFVVTPNSLKFNYYEEVGKFTNSKAHIVNWKKNEYTIEESKYIIVNYEFFNPSDKNKLQTKWGNLNIDVIDTMIADECQRLKNTKSNTYKNFKKIFNKDIFRDKKMSKVFMSGTPAPNRSYELYSVLNQISLLDFPTKKYFYEYYCGMTYDFGNGWGYVQDSEEAKFEELYHKISPYTHRKRKIDALNLPDKIYQKIAFEMNNKEYSIYEDIEKSVANDFIEHPASNPLTIMIRLRQYTAHLKIPYIIELIENILETGEKVVIVDMFKDGLYELKNKFGNIAGLHTGDQSVEERAEIVKEFQDKESGMKIFLGSIQTANYGLTLTAANKMFIITLPFVPGEYDQVADRCILKGELVLTKNGYIGIENIAIGDLVYTHKGNWKKVNYVSSKLERKKAFYNIKYKGFHKPLRCTEDHKIYVFDKSDEKYKWLLASELNIMDHYMVLSKYNGSNYTNEFIVKERNTKSHNKITINKNIQINKDILYAFGRFVGDGYTNDHQVSICGHIDEYDEILYSINSIKNTFNIKNHGEYKRDNKIEMYISSIELTINFKNWFGVRALNKRIPEFIFNLDDNEIRYFMNGYYGADGYQRNHTQQASTVSKYLSYQLILLESKLGNSPTISYNNAAHAWSFEYSLKNKIRRNTLIKNVDNHILFPIENIFIHKPKRGDERVYDLSVDDDNSFVVGLSSVHNCHRIGQKNTVNIYPLIFKDTIDEDVFSLIEEKRKEIIKVMDNENYVSSISESVLGDVIKKIGMKYGRNL